MAHRASNLPAVGAEPWEALVLDVELPGRPALRVEVAGRGLLVLRQNDTVVLMAQVDGDHGGVEYASTGRFQSPVPPVRAAHAAALGANRARWAHHFAAALTGSRQGPLHSGRWVISAGAAHLRSTFDASTLVERWEELVLPGGRGYIDWFTHNGAWQILPSRPPAAPTAGRVKAYRKQARLGILAPVLLVCRHQPAAGREPQNDRDRVRRHARVAPAGWHGTVAVVGGGAGAGLGCGIDP